MIVQSSIRTSLKTLTLLRGSLIAGFGALFIVFAGVFLTTENLKVWGWPVIIISFGFIAAGLIPYRRLCRLEMSPYEAVSHEGGLTFTAMGKKMFTIPSVSIGRIEYCEKGNRYGIGIWLKKPLPEKVLVHDRRFDIAYYQARAKRQFGCDLFLPFFTKRALGNLDL